MNDLIVLMTYTHEAGMMKQYIQQLSAAGIDVHAEKIADFKPKNKHGEAMETILPKARELVKGFSKYKFIVISDAFDVQFFGTKASVMEKIPEDGVLMAGERTCFPDVTLVDRIDGPTPFKYANGGLQAGTPKNFLDWFDYLEISSFYQPLITNQGLFNLMLMAKDTAIRLDYKTDLFYCLYYEKNELQFTKGIPENTLYGTHPNFIHANGKWPMSEIWDRFDWSMGKVEPIELVPTTIPFSSQITMDVCRRCHDRIVAKLNDMMGIKKD